MPDLDDTLAEAQRLLAASKLRIRELEAAEMQEERQAEAVVTLAAIEKPHQLEALSLDAIEHLREYGGEHHFAAMVERVRQHAPAASMHAKMRELLARQQAEPVDLAAVAAVAGAEGVLDDSTLFRLSSEQVREMKSGPLADLYWRSAKRLADDGERPYGHRVGYTVSA